MRMLLPKPDVRKMVRDNLAAFFRTEEQSHWDMALATIMAFYNLQVPTVEWVEKFDDSKIGGLCWESGKIQLQHPSKWKRNRKHRGLRRWREIVLHEIGHVILFSDGERKADIFADAMLK